MPTFKNHDHDPLAPYRDKRTTRCSLCKNRNLPALQKEEICRTCIVRDSMNEDIKDLPEETY